MPQFRVSVKGHYMVDAPDETAAHRIATDIANIAIDPPHFHCGEADCCGPVQDGGHVWLSSARFKVQEVAVEPI